MSLLVVIKTTKYMILKDYPVKDPGNPCSKCLSSSSKSGYFFFSSSDPNKLSGTSISVDVSVPMPAAHPFPKGCTRTTLSYVSITLFVFRFVIYVRLINLASIVSTSFVHFELSIFRSKCIFSLG